METQVVKRPSLSLIGPRAQIPFSDTAVGVTARFSPCGCDTVVGRGTEHTK